MLPPRLTTALVTVVALIGTTAAVAAQPVAVHPLKAKVSQGSVTITQTSVLDGQEMDSTVSFVGPLNVHGWSHTGTLSGTSTAYIWEAFSRSIPNFDVATGDGRVTGQCAGGHDDPVDDTTEVDVSDVANRHGFAFDCVLSYAGGTPWQVEIDALTTSPQKNDSYRRTFTGSYRLVDAETSVVDINEDITYGDAQLMEYTDDGGGVQWGPLRLSGQVMIGSVRYRGDIVSEVSPYIQAPPPPMAVSGSNAGQTVTGSCGSTSPGQVSQAIGQVESSFDWSCQLAVNGGPQTTVLLRTVFNGGGGRCSGRQCYSDYSGYFTNQ